MRNSTKVLRLSFALLAATLSGLPQGHAASPGILNLSMQSFKLGQLRIRVGVQDPAAAPIVGDVLFIHGFADRLDNHGPLFAAWNAAGLRVIAFDLPQHGEDAGLLNLLDLYSFEAIGKMAAQVYLAHAPSSPRPLILAGWSTGGLIATRIAQTGAFENANAPTLSGLILLAPAVAVPALVGELGFVTQDTLTHNPTPPHRGPISPRSPLEVPVFASKLLLNGVAARMESLPSDLPVLTAVGGDTEDLYVKTPEVRAWAIDQRDHRSVDMTGISCAGARHELDNEPALVGSDIRVSAASFARSAALRDRSIYIAPSSACTSF